MTVEQVDRFLKQTWENVKVIGRFRISGGEPLLHPDFMVITKKFLPFIKTKKMLKYVITTNGTFPIPDSLKKVGIAWIVSNTDKKKHTPFLVSPKDLGLVVERPCGIPRMCGSSLDKWGYLPCSPAIMLTRLLGKTDMYHHDYPKKGWSNIMELCSHCVFGLRKELRGGEGNVLKGMEGVVTKSFEVGIREYNDGWDTVNLKPY
jgi:hypothetical protein